jgi:high affinity sulfate transporter 1
MMTGVHQRTDGVGRQGRPLLFSSLHGYRLEWASTDAVAALTLLAIAVPEQLATSRLAGMPPITGLYAFVAGTVMFATLGSNPQLSVGADSTIAPLFAVGISRLAPTASTHYIDLVGILAVTVGVMVALVGLLRLGWIAEFLSEPIITGFLAGIAVIIVVHQLPDFLGIPPVSGTTVQRVAAIVRHLGDTNAWTVSIGLVVLAVMVVAEKVDRRIPGALIGLVGSTIVVAAFGLQAHGVTVLGSFSHSAPHFGLSDLSWSSIRSVAPLAGVVSLVVVTQSAATTRAFPGPRRRQVNISRDFLGVGAGSVVAGLAGSFPLNASPARTAAVATAGGRTQAAGLGAAAAVVLLVPAAGFLKDVPVATLAAVLLFVAARIFHVRDLRAIAHFDIFEFGLAMITLLTVALIGVEQGIGLAIGLAILDRTRLTARPQLHLLGRIPGTTSWAPLSTSDHPTQVPGIVVVLFATPLWYANATNFRVQVERALARAVGPPRAVVLDALGMTDIDYTGASSLGEVLDDLDRDHISYAVARAGARALTSLSRSGLRQRIGDERFFPSVDEAVTALAKGSPGPTPG